MEKKKLLLIGCGAMGEALLAVWQANFACLVIDPTYPGGLRSIKDIPDTFLPDYIVLAVKPQILPVVLAEITTSQFFVKLESNNFAKAATIWLSLAVGVPLSFLRKYLNNALLVRAMPNLAVRFNQGMTVLYADKGEIAEVDYLFSKTGSYFWVENDEQVDKAAAISGSGPAYFYALVEELIRAAVQIGFTDEQAQILSRQTAIGAGQVLQQLGQTPEALRQKVTSARGTTAAALGVLIDSDNSLRTLVARAVDAAFKRSLEISREINQEINREIS